MSSIDKRIVEMQFENSQFEKGVKESTKSLEKFKENLDFRDSEKSFENLQRAGDSFSLVKMASGIEAISDRFSTMGVVGMRVLQNLTDSAMRMGETFVKSVSVDQIGEGYKKYEQDTKAVQTIINATNLPIEKVEEQLQKLNWFTDETSYNYADMVNNIGKFTSNSVELDDAVTAMQGIATWAALSGQGATEASRAMYNLSQAIGSGALKTLDWRSIQGVNMGTPVFKETAIEVAKTLGVLDSAGNYLDKTGKKVKKVAVTVNSFDDTLAKGWLNREVLIGTLQKFGAYSDEVYKIVQEEGISAAEAMERVSTAGMELGEKAFKAAQEAKTFTDAIDATKDAVSTGWMTTFKTIFGNYEEAKELWTEFTEILYEMFVSGGVARNNLLKMWKVLEEGGREDLLTGLMDSLYALLDIVNAVKDAFHSIFPETTVDDLKRISLGVKEFGANLRGALEVTQKFVGVDYREVTELVKGGMEDFSGQLSKWSRGDEVKKLQERLVQLGYDVGPAGIDGILGPKTEAALNQFKKDYGLSIDGIYDEASHNAMAKALGLEDKEITKLEKVKQYVEEVPPALKTLRSILSGVFAILKIGVNVFKFLFNAGKSILSVFSPFGKVFIKIADAASRFFVALNERIEKTGKFQEWLDKLNKNLEPVRVKMEKFADTILNFLGLGGDLDKIDFDKVITNAVEAIKKFFGINVNPDEVVEGIDTKTIVEKVKDKIIEIYTKVRDWIVGLFSGVNQQGEKAQQINFDGYNIAILAISALVGSLSIQFLTLMRSITKTIKNVSKISENIKNITSVFSSKGSKVDKFSIVAKAVLEFAVAIGILAASVYVLSTLSWEGIAKGLITLVTIIGALIGATFALKYAARGFYNLTETAGLLLSISGAVLLLGVVARMFASLTWDQIGKGLVGIAGLLAIIIGALLVINKTKFDVKSVSGTIGIILSLGQGLGAMANVVKAIGSMELSVLIKGFLGMVAMMYALKKFLDSMSGLSINWQSVVAVVSVAIAIDLLIAGFLALSFSMKILKVSDLIKGFVSMAAIMVAMSKFIKSMGRMNPNWQAITSVIAVAVAVDLMMAGFLAVAFSMKLLKISDLIKAFTSMVAMMVALGLFIKALEHVDPNVPAIIALIPVALAIDLLIAGFIALSVTMKLVSWSDLGKSIVAMTSVMLILSGFMKLMSSFSASVKTVLSVIPMILSLAIALDAVIIGFIGLALTMKSVDTITLIKTIVSFGTVIGGMSAMLFGLSKISGGLKSAMSLLVAAVGIAGVMAVFALALKNIKSVKTSKILAFAGGVSMILVAFGGLAALSKVAGVSGIFTAAAAILVIGAAIGVLIAAITAILNIPGVGDALTKAAGVIGETIGSFTGAMKAADMKAFSKGMDGFKDVSQADEAAVNNAIKCAQLFADFANGLPSRSAGKVILDWMLESDMEQFSSDMVSFASGFNAFANEISKVEDVGELDEKTGYAVKIASAINGFAETLPEEDFSGRVLTFLFGSKIDQFKDDIGTFAEGFNAFAAEMAKVNDAGNLSDKTDYAIKIASSVNDFAVSLPEEDFSSRVLNFIGNSKIQQFSEDMSSFAGGFNAYAEEISKVNQSSKVTSGTAYAIAIAGAINDFASKLPEEDNSGRVLTFIIGSKMKQFTEDISTFAEGFNNYAAEISKVKQSAKVTEGTNFAITIAEAVNDFASKLPEEDNSGRVLTFLLGSKMNQFTEDMASFASGFDNFAALMGGISEPNKDLADRTSYAITISGQINEFASNLESKDLSSKVADFILGSKIDTFVEDMGSFATGFNSFAKLMGCIESPGSDLEDHTSYAIKIANQINSFGDNLEDKDIVSRVADFIMGSNIQNLSGDMTIFANGFNNFATTMLNINPPEKDLEDRTSYAVRIANQINTFGDNLEDKDINTRVIEFLTGSSIANFTNDMTSFAEGFNRFVSEMSMIEYSDDLDTKTGNAVSIATQVASFVSSLDTLTIDSYQNILDKWFGGDLKQNTVFDAIGDLAAAIVGSQDSFSGISSGTLEQDVKAAIGAAQAVAEFLNYLGGEDVHLDTVNWSDPQTSNIFNWTNGIDSIAKSINQFAMDTEGIDLSAVAAAISAINGFMSLLANSTNVTADDFLSNFNIEAVTESIESVGVVFENGMADAVVNAVKSTKSFAPDFVDAGEYFAFGLARGIENNAWLAEQAAFAVGQRMLDAAMLAIDANSPSKEAAKIGGYFAIGLGKGVTDNLSIVEASSEQAAVSMLDTAKNSLMSLSSILAEDIDDTPVISPVVDLTNARYAASSIGGMFGTQTFGLESRMMAGRTMTGLDSTKGTVSVRDNGSQDIVGAINDMNERINGLGDAISKMKVVVESGALIGQIENGIDQRLGDRSVYAERGMM